MQPPRVRLLNSLVFNLLHLLPLFLRGIVVPERRWTARSARWLNDPVSVRFIHRLRRKYQGDWFFIRVFEFGANRLPRFKPVLLITGTDDIEAVLFDPDNYGSDALATEPAQR